MTQPHAEAAKIQSLEGLRGLMAWWVVVGHVSHSFGWRLPLTDRNTLPVDVFILLSGFVIARLIDRRGEGYGPYLTRRACRLFPPYLVVLAVSAVLLPVQLQAWTAAPFTDDNRDRIFLAQQGLAHLPAHLAVHLALLQGLIPRSILPGAAYTIVGHGWSLSLEWQFYLVAPLIMAALVAGKRIPGLLLVAFAALLIVLAPHFVEGFLGARILHFLIGMGSYLALNRPGERRIWLGAVLALAILAVALSGLWQIAPLAIWALALASSSAPSHSPAHLPARALGSKPAVHFGEMSYSLYLVHMIPLFSAIFVLTRLGLTGAGLQASVLAATLIGSYALARLNFLFVERPAIALGARLTKRSI